MNMKKLIKDIIWRIIRTPVFNGIRPRIVHTRSFLLKGKTKGNLDMSILVFTNYENIANYVSDLAYSQERQVQDMGRVTYHELSSIVANTKPDMVFAELEAIFLDFFSKKEFLILPRINFSLDISSPLELIRERTMRVRRRNIQKIERFPYTYEVTNDLEKLNLFYNRIYLPLISETANSNFGRPTPMETAKEWFQKGELLLVKSDDKYVSGLLYHPENASMHCRMIAYTEGIAGQAALYHSIQNLKEKGYARINYGDTSPFMSDGLFFYKKSWGMEMKPRLKDCMIFGIKFCNFEETVQDFLRNNPFIFTDRGSLISLILSDSNDVDPASLCRKYYSPGLHKLMAFRPEKNRDTNRMLAPLDGSSPMLGAVNLITKLASKRDFATCMFDFSEYLAKSNVAGIGDVES